MSRRYSGSSDSGSEGSEKPPDFFEMRRNKKKLGAQFFTDPNSNSSNPSTSVSSSSNRGTQIKASKNPKQKATSSAGAGVSVSRSRAAIWPSVSDTEDTDPDLDVSDKNNNGLRARLHFKNENYESKEPQDNSALSDELTTVTEQLQIIQMTQEMILSELRSDVESLQTENLCLQHHNTRLRVQVDHLNELVFELSKELNLMREFVKARNEQSPTKPGNVKGKTKAKKTIEKADLRPSNAPPNSDSEKSGRSSKKKDLKEKMKNKSKNEKNRKDENADSDEATINKPATATGRSFGFFSSIFRSRKPKPEAERRLSHSRHSRSRSSISSRE